MDEQLYLPQTPSADHLSHKDGKALTFPCGHQIPPPAPGAFPGRGRRWEEWGDMLSFLEWAGTGKSLLADEYISEAQLSKQRKCFTETNAMSLNPP